MSGHLNGKLTTLEKHLHTSLRPLIRPQVLVQSAEMGADGKVVVQVCRDTGALTVASLEELPAVCHSLFSTGCASDSLPHRSQDVSILHRPLSLVLHLCLLVSSSIWFCFSARSSG